MRPKCRLLFLIIRLLNYYFHTLVTHTHFSKGALCCQVTCDLDVLLMVFFFSLILHLLFLSHTICFASLFAFGQAPVANIGVHQILCLSEALSLSYAWSLLVKVHSCSKSHSMGWFSLSLKFSASSRNPTSPSCAHSGNCWRLGSTTTVINQSLCCKMAQFLNGRGPRILLFPWLTQPWVGRSIELPIMTPLNFSNCSDLTRTYCRWSGYALPQCTLFDIESLTALLIVHPLWENVAALK